MATLTVSLVQMNVRKGAPRTNWTTMQQYTVQAAQQGAQLVVFPELWDAGGAFDKGREMASSLSGGLFAQVVALARQHNIHILGSLYEKRGTGVCNTMAVISPRNGVMGAYRKIHLFPLMQEDRWLLPGEAPLTIDLPWAGRDSPSATTCVSQSYSAATRQSAPRLWSCRWPGRTRAWPITARCCARGPLRTSASWSL